MIATSKLGPWNDRWYYTTVFYGSYHVIYIYMVWYIYIYGLLYGLQHDINIYKPLTNLSFQAVWWFFSVVNGETEESGFLFDRVWWLSSWGYNMGINKFIVCCVFFPLWGYNGGELMTYLRWMSMFGDHYLTYSFREKSKSIVQISSLSRLIPIKISNIIKQIRQCLVIVWQFAFGKDGGSCILDFVWALEHVQICSNGFGKGKSLMDIDGSLGFWWTSSLFLGIFIDFFCSWCWGLWDFQNGHHQCVSPLG